MSEKFINMDCSIKSSLNEYTVAIMFSTRGIHVVVVNSQCHKHILIPSKFTNSLYTHYNTLDVVSVTAYQCSEILYRQPDICIY